MDYLQQLKANLEIGTSMRDDYLKELIRTAKDVLERKAFRSRKRRTDTLRRNTGIWSSCMRRTTTGSGRTIRQKCRICSDMPETAIYCT